MVLFLKSVSIKVSQLLSDVLTQTQFSLSVPLMIAFFNLNFKVLFSLHQSLIGKNTLPQYLLQDERHVLLNNFNYHWTKLGKAQADFVDQIPHFFTCYSIGLEESHQVSLSSLISLFEAKHSANHLMFPVQEQTIYILDKLIRTLVDPSIFRNFFPQK